jgi:hypothetical protein
MDRVKFPEIAPVPEFFRRHHVAQDAAYKSSKRYVSGFFLPPGNLTMVSQRGVEPPVNYRRSS